MGHERACLVGTAQSWKLTPWTDTGLFIVSLNDAYRLQGFQRADRWYDLHPADKFFFAPPDRLLAPHEVPAGSYVRPADHIGWLARQAQTIEVFLHHDFSRTVPAMTTWPKAHAFPKAEIEAEHGRYFTSSPGWILAHLVMEGVKELRIYGIHLATEHEYIEQRPNFEFLCGRILGRGKLKQTVKDGMRYYETRDGLVVLPEASPVLASDFQYAYETRPAAKLEPAKWDVHRFTIKRERAIEALKRKPWWKTATAMRRDLWAIDARLHDAQERLQRADLVRHWR